MLGLSTKKNGYLRSPTRVTCAVPRSIDIDDLAPDTTFEIRGTLSFSRLRSPIRGKELARHNRWRIEHGGASIDRPHTTATVHDAWVVYSPENPTPTQEECFAEQLLYQSKTEGHKKCFTAFNKGYILPYIALREPENGDIREIHAQGELAKGLDVTLQLRVFKSRMGCNGVTLDGVVVEEPIRYYQGYKSYGKWLHRTSEHEHEDEIEISLVRN